jgi:hypothetical protein
MDQSFLNRPELSGLDPVKKKFLAELVEEAQKTPQKNMPTLYMKAISKMNTLRLKFSPEESALLSEILEAQMSKEDRKRFDAVKKMLLK